MGCTPRGEKKLMSFYPVLIAFILLVTSCTETLFAQSRIGAGTGKEGGHRLRKSEGLRMRNPFLLPPGVYPLSKDGSDSFRRVKEKPKENEREEKAEIREVSPEIPLEVKAILISDQIRLATIGSQIVAVGDRLHDETVVAIMKDRVILGKGSRQRTLPLRQSPIQLKIEPPISLSDGQHFQKGVQERKKGEEP